MTRKWRIAYEGPNSLDGVNLEDAIDLLKTHVRPAGSSDSPVDITARFAILGIDPAGVTEHTVVIQSRSGGKMVNYSASSMGSTAPISVYVDHESNLNWLIIDHYRYLIKHDNG